MKEMKLYEHPAGLAAALLSGIVYIVCFLAVSLWPSISLWFFANWFHGIDMMKIAVMPKFNFGSFIIGLISIMAFFYLIGFTFVFIYNKCVMHCKKKN